MTIGGIPRSILTRAALIMCATLATSCAPAPEGQPFADDSGPAVDIGLPDETSPEGFDQDTEENILRSEREIAESFADADSEINEDEAAQIMADSYSHLDPKRLIRPGLLKKAVAYFDRNKSKFSNRSYITLVDFQKKSSSARFFVVNMKSGSVASYFVAHGKGSDPNNDAFPEKFSNKEGSGASSLGPVRVAETYSGKYGRSVRIDGLSSSNSNMRRRAVVIHGSNYVKNANVKQGRSEGCFAIPMNQKDSIISLIKGGSFLYADQVR